MDQTPADAPGERPAARPAEQRAAAIGALADPVRRALYDHVAAAAPAAVGREEAATAVGVPVHTAKFHLERLAELGLLETEFRRLTGRTGPGAGRPAKLYRRTAGEVALSLPPRHYDLAGEVLAAALERVAESGEPVAHAVAEVATQAGRALAREAAEPQPGRSGSPAGPAAQLARAAALLARHGYEPREPEDRAAPAGDPDRATRLELGNCPFDRLAREHTALVCGANVALVGGTLEALPCPDLVARLDPGAGRCCVTVGARE